MLIDGLQCGHFNRSSFEELKAAGVGGVTVTCGFWEGAINSLDSIAKWRDLVRANEDIATIVMKAADIERAHRDGKVGIVLGFQNAAASRAVSASSSSSPSSACASSSSPTTTRTSSAAAATKSEDSGLARFGREVIREMNRTGILVDLSHVGNRTTLDAIKHSEKPVAVTHANAEILFAHKRNKTDDVLRRLRDTGGVIGCATYRNIVGDEYSETVEKWSALVARAVDLAGIDHVAFGTDTNHNKRVPEDLDWMRKGYWTRGEDFGAGSRERPGAVPPPTWYQRPSQLGILRQGLINFGFNDEEADKITHRNWMRVYGEVFG